MQRANYDNVALGALEAVMTRREASIVKLAEVGDPAGFTRMHANYGEEQLAGCRVRWKIEPAIIREPMARKLNADSVEVDDPGGFRRFIFNPPASTSEAINTGEYALQNDFVYIYRISGESQYLPGGDEWGTVHMRFLGFSRFAMLRLSRSRFFVM